MTADVTQAEYGVFNPRFVGISMTYETPENYRTVLDYLLGSAETPDVATDLNSISLLTVLDHEVRHFHDFLLSPYSTHLFRLRLQALANGGQALAAMKQLPGSCLPIPVSRWLDVDAERREAYVAEWRADLGDDGLRPVPLPYRGQKLADTPAGVHPVRDLPAQEQVDRFVEAAARGYARIEELSEGFSRLGMAFIPRNVHEVSAQTVQLASAWRSLGADQFAILLNWMLDTPLPHLECWRRFLQVAMRMEKTVRGEGPDLLFAALARTQALATWCLLGNYHLDGRSACPALRFELLLGQFVDDPDNAAWTGDVDDDAELARTWDHWDTAAGVSSWRASLEELVALGERGVVQYEDLRRQGDNGPMVDVMVEVLETCTRWQEPVVDRLLSQPRLFANPWRYIDGEGIGDLARPPVRLDLRNHGVEAGSIGGARILAHFQRGEKTYASSIGIPAEVTDAAWQHLDRAVELEQFMVICDVAFSDRMVPDHLVGQARQVVRDVTGKLPLQIIETGRRRAAPPSVGSARASRPDAASRPSGPGPRQRRSG